MASCQVFVLYLYALCTRICTVFAHIAKVFSIQRQNASSLNVAISGAGNVTSARLPAFSAAMSRRRGQ